MDGIDVMAARAKIERVKGRLAELDALDRDLDALLGPSTAPVAITVSSDDDPERLAKSVATHVDAKLRQATQRRAGPKPKASVPKRSKAKAVPTASSESASAPTAPKRPRPTADVETPKSAIVKLLEDGPLTAEEFSAALGQIPESVGTYEAKRQALARLAKAGTVQKLPDGGYQLARPT